VRRFADEFGAIGVVEQHIPVLKEPLIAIDLVLWNKLEVAEVNPPLRGDIHRTKMRDLVLIPAVSAARESGLHINGKPVGESGRRPPFRQLPVLPSIVAHGGKTD
jgi:hypothetical protein